MDQLQTSKDPIRIGAWLAPELAESVHQALLNADITLQLVAGEGPHITQLSEEHGVEVCSDPRALFAPDVSCVLVADPNLSLDTEMIATMSRDSLRSDIRLCSLIPRPVEFSELLQLQDSVPLPRLVPLMSDTARGRTFLDDAVSFGPIDSVHVSFDTTRPFGSSSSRLYDGFDVLHTLMGTPLTVEAASPARHGEHEHRNIRQVMAIARFDDGRAASVHAGGNCGGWSRTVTIWGEQGRMRWIDGMVDYSDELVTAEGDEVEPSIVRPRFIDELSESIAHCVASPAVPDHDRQLLVHSSVEACRLAMKTGEPESVQGVRDILRRV